MAITGPNEGRLPCERFPLGTQMAPLQAEAPPRANAGRQQAPAALAWPHMTYSAREWWAFMVLMLVSAHIRGTYDSTCDTFGGRGRDARHP